MFKKILTSAVFMFAIVGDVQAFELANKYSFNSGLWIVKAVPEGHAFICKSCNTEIRVQITYGPPNSEVTVAKFEKMLVSEQAQRLFAKDLIAKQIPFKSGVEIKISKISYGDLFNLRVLAFSAVVEMRGLVLRDTSYIGVHRDQFMKLTINYVDGDLDETGRTALNQMMSSLKFKR